MTGDVVLHQVIRGGQLLRTFTCPECHHDSDARPRRDLIGSAPEPGVEHYELWCKMRSCAFSTSFEIRREL